MNEYIVVANSETDIDSLHVDLTLDTTGRNGVNHRTIPDRPVGVANPRLGNPRITHYYLTDQEAADLDKDTRVVAVHRPPNPDSRMHHAVQRNRAYDGTNGNFNRNSADDKYNVNWGLRRSSLLKAEAATGNSYEYDNDGAGVDIIIMDDGIDWEHPEFLDSTGASRVRRIDWYAATGIPGTMPPNHYVCRTTGGDSQGQHGTHVASTAAGKTFGAAKNARLYSIRVFGDTSQAIDSDDQFDLIRVWHKKKPIDPKTGARRPTVVNMSWGYAWYYNDNKNYNIINSIKYRGTLNTYNTPVEPQQRYGMQPGYNGIHGLEIPSVDAEVTDAEKEGVIFVHSSGNYGNKIDVARGKDYDNYYTTNNYYAGVFPPGSPIYYHRGGSPRSTNVITVSAASQSPIYRGNLLLEVLGTYSERGPGCDVVAPGTMITAATSRAASNSDPAQSGFRPLNPYMFGRPPSTDPAQNHYVCKISGTSMAAPQVTGVLALYLSKNPKTTPANCKKWIQNFGIKNQISTSAKDDDWYNSTALLGGPNNYLYNPYRGGYKG